MKKNSDTTLKGFAQTVLGPVPAEDLGITLPHEHLFIDVTCLFEPPTEATVRGRAHEKISLENIGWIRQNYFRHYENLLLTDEDCAIAEAGLFQRAGGRTIVDVSPPGIGRDPLALARTARATGLNIIMATGFYVAPTHPPVVARMDEDEILEVMRQEIQSGAVLQYGSGASQDWQAESRPTGVKAGVIKVGCSFPLVPSERKVLRSAARAQRQTGAPISVHVGRHDSSALEIAQVLQDAGADLSRVVLDHLDFRVEKPETWAALAKLGCYLELDLFGHEISYYPLVPRDMPNDTMRIDLIDRLRHLGRLERILISHDICTKHRLVRYGGHGYAYIPTCILPRLRERGFTSDEIDTIVVRNPARLFAFASPQK